MNNDFNFRAKRTILIMLFMCAVLFFVIVKAFDFLPQENNNTAVPQQKMADTQKVENIPEEETEPLQEKRKTLNINLPQTADLDKTSEITNIPPTEDFEEIKDDSATQKEPIQTKEEQINQLFTEAAKAKAAKEYTNALNKYQEILSLVEDVDAKAKCYEGIATIYAIGKKYGSALSFAQKAYNLSPTSSREILLARIYYKTGDINKATTRINNVLQRDFASDRE